jgi:hypothetical protein
MLANVLYFAYVIFLTMFVAAVIVGHVLLLHAMLPDLLPKKREPRKRARDVVQDAATTPAPPVVQSQTMAARDWPSSRSHPGRRAPSMRIAPS